jgi:RHS repeat-associated protein
MLRTSFTLALAVVTTTAIARAQNVESLDAIPPAVTGVPAQPFAGAGQHRVPLTVPAWRGLEPALAITYASNAKAGWLGVGMTLEGVSTIERVSANLGAPTYGASDTYLLDGEPMIACVAGSPSPSCLTGGTHTTKRERYVRIVKAGTTWTVTSPTGVADVYTTLAEPFAVLTSRTDRSGNAVTFSYAVVSGTTYPTSIAYNGTTISFAREARPEPLTLGTGAGLRQISQRLVAIAIRTDGALERAYRLSYGNAALPVGGGGWMGGSTAPGRSFLTAVQEYGSDATFNGAGAITGGTALPATSLTYNSDTPALSAGWSATLTRTATTTTDTTVFGDVNGDGRDDAIAIRRYSTGGTTITGSLNVQVALGQANGTFATTATSATTTANPNIGYYDDTRTGDVNGDGRTDVIWVRRKSTYACCGAAPVGFVDVQLALGTAAGSFTFPAVQRVSNVGDTSTYKEVVVGDFDGNGGADLAIVRLNHSNGVYTASNALIALSNGSGLGTATARTLNINDSGGPFGSAPSFAGARFHAGDVNGDGRDDLVLVRRASSICGTNLTTANAHLSAGNGTFAAPVYSLLTNACSHASFAGETLTDLNGDGLADLVGDSAFTVYGAVCSDCDSDVKIIANLGNGNGSFGGAITSVGWSGAGVGIGSFTASFVDVNGDKLADRVAVKGGTSLSVLVSHGRGDGSFLAGSVASVATASSSWINGGPVAMADVDGDGRVAPVAGKCNSTSWQLLTLGPSAQFGGLLTNVALPSGGSVGLGYATSSSFPNGYLPFAFPVVTTSRLRDGRGRDDATTYSYTGGLYSPLERRFLGFATARVKDPANPYRDLAYTQHVADPAGTIASVHERSAAGLLMRYETTTFARSGNGTTAPYTSNPSRRYDFECNTAPTCKSASRGWTYTAYGAVASEIEYGDDALTGDERTTFRTQVVNPTAFITQLDATVTVRAGAGVATGTQLRSTELRYDGATTAATAPTRGLLTATLRWRGGTNYVVEQTQYDAAGNPTATIDPLGHTTTQTYDARQRVIATANPLGHSETRTYDALGRLATLTDANGGVTSHGYDVFGRLVQRTTPDGGTATAAFANWGNPNTQYVQTAIADGTADGLWTRTYLDGLGRTVRVVNEGGLTTDSVYGARGLLIQHSAPYLTGATPLWSTTKYDAVRRPIEMQEPDGAITLITYSNGRISTTDHRGLVTERYYDGYRQLVQVIERTAVPQTTSITYDLLGQRVAIVDAKGNTTTNAYDPLGRRVAVVDPDLGQWQYSYDDAGRMVSQTDARGVTIDTSYDALGRPVERRHGATTLAAFTYDQVRASAANVGRLTGFTDPTGSTLRDYDPVGRLRAETKTIGADTFQVDWSFDVAGRVAAIRYPAVAGVREQVTQTYDASGRVIGVGEYVSGATYDARGNLTAATYGNGASVARSYSPTRGWMMGQTVTTGGVVRDQFAVTRAASGDILTRTSAVTARDAWQFSYDALGRLTVANNTVDNSLDETFGYDALGDRLSAQRGGVTTTYQYPVGGAPRPHAPTAIGGVAVRYDANGNRLGIGLAPDAIYDASNRLVDDGVTTYAYDAEGTRVRAGAKVFVRDLLEVEGATSIRYYYLGRERVARRDHTGVVAYYHGDSIGTVRALTAASGAVAGTRLGFAFGELAETTGLADPFGIAGQRRDASGLYHMGARMMDPAHGQFTQPDPSGAPDPARPQTLNRYAYASGNPIRISDPTGFQDKEEDDELPKTPERDADATDDAPPGRTGASDVGKMRIRILRNTPEGLTWTDDSQPGSQFQAPRLYSRSFEQERAQNAWDPRYAFESKTGRLFGEGAYASVPFWTMGDAIAHIDTLRSRGVGTVVAPPYAEHDPREPQYLEGNDGSTFRYNSDGSIDAIEPAEIPGSVGIDQNLYIFLEALTS